MEKNLIGNNGSVDEELLRKFFADSARMQVADNGFSLRVMRHLQEEVPERQRMIYNIWTAVWAVACVVAFFVNNGVGWIKALSGSAYSHVVAVLPKGMPNLDLDLNLNSLLSHVNVSGTTLLMAALTVVVLSGVTIWNEAQE